jgi:hypothetical protein
MFKIKYDLLEEFEDTNGAIRIRMLGLFRPFPYFYDFEIFVFPIFWLWSYMIHVVTETLGALYLIDICIAILC